jgi:hypothetical protein
VGSETAYQASSGFAFMTDAMAAQARPAGKIGAQPFSAGGGEAVIFGVPVIFTFAPLSGDQSLALEAVERRVKRALLNLQRTV